MFELSYYEIFIIVCSEIKTKVVDESNYDNLLTLLYGFEFVCSLVIFIKYDSLLIFITSFVFVIFTIRFFKYIAQWILRTVNLDTKNSRKFSDQFWQFGTHFSFTLAEYYILSTNNFEWLFKPYLCFKNLLFQENDTVISFFFFTQVSVWIYTAFSHRFLEGKEDRRSDYYVMYIHHVFTIALLLCSFQLNMLRMGVVTLFIHDSSDVLIDILKLVNYLQLEGMKYFFITEMTFCLNLISWVYFRLYLFPAYILQYSMKANISSIINPDGSLNLYNELKNQLGEDSDIFYMITVIVGPFMILFIICIYFMHVYWFFLLLNILLKLIMKESANSASKLYEIDNDKKNN